MKNVCLETKAVSAGILIVVDWLAEIGGSFLCAHLFLILALQTVELNKGNASSVSTFAGVANNVGGRKALTVLHVLAFSLTIRVEKSRIRHKCQQTSLKLKRNSRNQTLHFYSEVIFLLLFIKRYFLFKQFVDFGVFSTLRQPRSPTSRLTWSQHHILLKFKELIKKQDHQRWISTVDKLQVVWQMDRLMANG